jgi:hypothetical protein
LFAVIDKPSSPKEYNSLPGIMEADAAIKPFQGPLDQLVDQGSEVCSSTPFALGVTGAFLLHKHWEVQAGERMIERPGRHPSGRPALITSARRFPKTSTVAPSRFKVDPQRRELVPLEFSSDEFVVQVWHALREHPTFLESVCRLIGDSGLADQIGFAIFARAAVPVMEGEEVVEENWSKKSVLSAQVLVENEQEVFVPTGWAFVSASESDLMAASTQCIAYCMLFAGFHCSHHYNRPETLPEKLATAPPPVCQLHDD